MDETTLINRLKASGLQHSVAETVAGAIQDGTTQAKASIIKWISIYCTAIVAIVLSLCILLFLFFRSEMERVDNEMNKSFEEVNDDVEARLGIVDTNVEAVEGNVKNTTIDVRVLKSKVETAEFDIRVLQSTVQDLNNQAIEFKHTLNCARHPIGQCPARLDED